MKQRTCKQVKAVPERAEPKQEERREAKLTPAARRKVEQQEKRRGR